MGMTFKKICDRDQPHLPRIKARASEITGAIYQTLFLQTYCSEEDWLEWKSRGKDPSINFISITYEMDDWT